MHKIILNEEWQERSIFQLPSERKTSNKYKVPINWILVPYKLNREKGVLEFGKGKEKMFLGFCMATEHLIKMQPDTTTGFMTAVLVKDTYVEAENGKLVACEEQRRCLNIECPVNQTIKETFAQGTGLGKNVKGWNWDAISSYRKITWDDVNK